VLRVTAASEMRDVIVPETADADVLVMAAAVADYQSSEPVADKIKREVSEGLMLSLARTPDILAEVGSRDRLVKVGFAAESQDLLANATHKLKTQGLHLIVANDI